MESILLASFIAGFLTVLAPCILPLLPVVIGGSLTSNTETKRNSYIIILALIISIVSFTLIIEGISSLFYVPGYVWDYISASLILIVGITFLFPVLWLKLPLVASLSRESNKSLGQGAQKKGLWGDVIIGASLGPVFSSCSPTYFLILGIVLPRDFLEGLIYITAYVIGLGVVLLFIILIGEKFLSKLNVLASEKGKFKKSIGTIMIVIAILIYTGLDKEIATQLLDWGFFNSADLELDVDIE